MIALNADRISESPDLASVVQRQTAQRVLLSLAIVIHQVNASVQNSRACIAVTHLNRPDWPQPTVVPGTGEVLGIVADAVTLLSAKARPGAGPVGGDRGSPLGND